MELVARGLGHTLRKELPKAGTLTLGRQILQDVAIGWDQHISREHLVLTVAGQSLNVKQADKAHNPVLYRGEPMSEFVVGPGDEFVIGETVFRVVASPDESEVVTDRTVSRAESESVDFVDLPERLEMLIRLPDELAEFDTLEQSAARILDTLLRGIPRADAVAVVQSPSEAHPSGVAVHRTRNPHQEFLPSRKLVHKALVEVRETRLQTWAHASDLQYTCTKGLDWAFCTPIRSHGRTDWGLYIAGGSESRDKSVERSLLPDVKFTEVLARFLGVIYDLRMMEGHRARLSVFLPPTVVDEVLKKSDELLRPRPVPIAVMFCDLRNFSTISEQLENLSELLAQIREALGLVTKEIARQEGAISDFRGDSVRCYWGWPLETDLACVMACRAALEVLAAFRRARAERADFVFRMGIGIAHGTALCGQVGMKEQFNLGVFGPVVNLSSRLEGLTSAWGEMVVINDATYQSAQKYLQANEGQFRRLGKFRLYGLNEPVVIHELMSVAADAPRLTPEQLRQFNAGATALFAQDWAVARELLGGLRSLDGPSRTMCEFLDAFPDGPPQDWDGVIPIGFKRVMPEPVAK